MGMRQHHSKSHGQRLPNCTCKVCGDAFYDSNGKDSRSRCDSCVDMGVHSNKPDGVELPEGESWDSLTPFQRHYYRNKTEYIEKNKERRDQLRRKVSKYKSRRGCSRCSEDHISCLDFHHESADEKEENISRMVEKTYSWESILKEIQKCELICANCHRKIHANSFDFIV